MTVPAGFGTWTGLDFKGKLRPLRRRHMPAGEIISAPEELGFPFVRKLAKKDGHAFYFELLGDLESRGAADDLPRWMYHCIVQERGMTAPGDDRAKVNSGKAERPVSSEDETVKFGSTPHGAADENISDREDQTIDTPPPERQPPTPAGSEPPESFFHEKTIRSDSIGPEGARIPAQPSQPDALFPPNTEFGAFRLIAQLGRGGQAEVYAARYELKLVRRQMEEKAKLELAGRGGAGVDPGQVENLLAQCASDLPAERRTEIAGFLAGVSTSDEKRQFAERVEQLLKEKLKDILTRLEKPLKEKLGIEYVAPGSSWREQVELQDIESVTFALKILLPEYTSPDSIEAFKGEYEVLANSALTYHDGIVRVFDAGQMGNHYFYTMEILDGEVPSRKKLPLDETLFIIRQTAEALAYMHEHAIYHRDLKPGNIMFRKTAKGRRAVLTDFGLAKIKTAKTVSLGVVKGTLNYMSPEQASGSGVDNRTDIYSLGAVFYELLTGRPPSYHVEKGTAGRSLDKALGWLSSRVARQSSIQVHTDVQYILEQGYLGEEVSGQLNAIMNLQADLKRFPRECNRQTPRSVENVVLKMLNKRRADRYQTMGEVAEDLALLTEDKKPRLAGHAWRRRTSRQVRIHRRALAVGVFVMILAGATLWGRALWERQYEVMLVSNRYSSVQDFPVSFLTRIGTSHEDKQLRLRAIQMLGEQGSDAAREELLDLLQNRDPDTRRYSMEALAEHYAADPSAVQAILQRLRSLNNSSSHAELAGALAAFKSLCREGKSQERMELTRWLFLNAPSKSLRNAAVTQLKEWGQPPTTEDYDKILDSADKDLVSFAIGHVPPERLERLLDSPKKEIRGLVRREYMRRAPLELILARIGKMDHDLVERLRHRLIQDARSFRYKRKDKPSVSKKLVVQGLVTVLGHAGTDEGNAREICQELRNVTGIPLSHEKQQWLGWWEEVKAGYTTHNGTFEEWMKHQSGVVLAELPKLRDSLAAGPYSPGKVGQIFAQLRPYIQSEKFKKWLAACLEDPEKSVRLSVCEMAKIGGVYVPELLRAARDPDPFVMRSAVEALRRSARGAADTYYAMHLRDPDPAIRASAVTAAGYSFNDSPGLGPGLITQLLRDAFGDKDQKVRQAAIVALPLVLDTGLVAPALWHQDLIKALSNDPDEDMFRSASLASLRLGADPVMGKRILALLAQKDWGRTAVLNATQAAAHHTRRTQAEVFSELLKGQSKDRLPVQTVSLIWIPNEKLARSLLQHKDLEVRKKVCQSLYSTYDRTLALRLLCETAEDPQQPEEIQKEATRRLAQLLRLGKSGQDPLAFWKARRNTHTLRSYVIVYRQIGPGQHNPLRELKQGDVILRAAGKLISWRSDLERVALDSKPEEPVEMELRRGSGKVTVKVPLGGPAARGWIIASLSSKAALVPKSKNTNPANKEK